MTSSSSEVLTSRISPSSRTLNLVILPSFAANLLHPLPNKINAVFNSTAHLDVAALPQEISKVTAEDTQPRVAKVNCVHRKAVVVDTGPIIHKSPSAVVAINDNNVAGTITIGVTTTTEEVETITVETTTEEGGTITMVAIGTMAATTMAGVTTTVGTTTVVGTPTGVETTTEGVATTTEGVATTMDRETT
jgi:hypothetical protein